MTTYRSTELRCRAIVLKHWAGTWLASSAYASTGNGISASNGLMTVPDTQKL
ncbi:MAG: hypothetical protein OXF20_01675 [Gammaproteobacteria bacterium]|nr:hypothetical protein [Gammaproteobacteria bacterium]